ncbi:MAG: NADPH:quinone oxidoreductase family protein [Acidimicrobiia bacterium]
MRAVVCTEIGPPDRLVVQAHPEPSPGPGQVLVDVAAASVNFPDLLLVQGLYQHSEAPPFVPGGEGAGSVAAVGEGVTDVAVGDEVMFVALSGAFAERAVADAGWVFPKPQGMPVEQAAAFSFTYGTSFHALVQRAELKPGETMLVLGAAGGVGSSAVQIGKVLGARVIAAASTGEKLEFARTLGADEVINYGTEDLRARMKDLTGGKGADVVYDPVGGDLTEQALRSTGWGGRYLVIGFAAGAIPKIPLNLPLLKGYAVVGVFWGGWMRRDSSGAHRNAAELARLYAEGKLAPRLMDVFDLDQQRQAFAAMSGRSVMGKVVLRIG